MACGPSSERPRGVLALFLALNREGQGESATEDEGEWRTGQRTDGVVSFLLVMFIAFVCPSFRPDAAAKSTPRLIALLPCLPPSRSGIYPYGSGKGEAHER